MEDDVPPAQKPIAVVPAPTTALAAALPLPPKTRSDLRALVERTFDAVDEIADTVAHGFGLR